MLDRAAKSDKESFRNVSRRGQVWVHIVARIFHLLWGNIQVFLIS